MVFNKEGNRQQEEIKDEQNTLPFCYICLETIDKICSKDRLILCDGCYKKVESMARNV
tara:strand:- start:144 stop:317 length:174 start_codon:yes stop_codon:yes gene_type:complete